MRAVLPGLFGLLPLSLGLEQSYYVPFKLTSDLWPTLISHTLSHDVNNPIECGAFCNTKTDGICRLFAVKDNACYLGSLDNEYTHLTGQTYDQIVYVNREDLSAEPRYVSVSPVSGSSWSNTILEDIPGVNEPDDCAAYCMFRPGSCAFFVLEDKKCFLGSLGVGGASADVTTLGPWNVYVRPDFLSSYLVPEADTEQWSRHLYRELSTTDPYVCKGFCTFDPECHFNAFLPEDGKCFLGNFSVVTGVSVTTDILNLDIQVMPDRFNHSLDDQKTVYGRAQSSSLIYSFATQTLSHCSALCYLRKSCQFYSEVQGVERQCFLGSYSAQQSSTSITMNTYSLAYYLLDRIVDLHESDHFHRIPANTMEWRSLQAGLQVEVEKDSEQSVTAVAESMDECAFLFLFEVVNGFYVWTDDQCYVGTVWTRPYEVDGLTEVEMETLHWGKGYVTKRPPSAMDVLNPPLSEDPSSKVYKVHLPLAESADAAAAATDSDWGLRECKFYCYKEFHHCQGLLFDGTKCYLTSTFVNVDPPTVNVPRELTWNTLTYRAGIVMGGHDGTGNIHTSVLVQLKNDVTCSSPPIPSVPSNAQELYGRPMAYVEPFLIMSGGWNSDGSSVKSTLTLDLLDLFPMAWVEAASMSHSRAFHQILPRSASAVLAIGGLESNQTCHKSIEEFETTTGVWTDLGDLLLEARAEFCAVESKDKFYIVGGFSCDANEALSTMEIIDKTSLIVSAGTPLNIARREVACTVFDDSRLVVVGGRAMGYSAPSEAVEVLTLDGTSNFLTIAAETFWGSIPPPSMWAFGSSSSVLDLEDVEASSMRMVLAGTSDEYGLRPLKCQLSSSGDMWKLYDDSTDSFEIRLHPSQSVVPLSKLPACMIQPFKWFLVFKQDATKEFPERDDEDSNWNSNDPYSILGNLEAMRSWSCDANFHFKLVWGGLTFYNEWRQSSNPILSDRVEGFQAINIGYGNDFIGLHMVNNEETLLSGSAASFRHYSVGQRMINNSELWGLPSADSAQDIIPKDVSLYIQRDC